MTTNTAFRRAADRIRQSAFVLPIFSVFLALLIIALVISYEDFWTSFWGYSAIPTEKGFTLTLYAVALLPQIGQAAAAYIMIALADNPEDRLYVILASVAWVLLFAIDVYSDVFYRIDYAWLTASNEVLYTAVAQSIGIFTIGSELAFVVGFGMVGELVPDAIAESLSLYGRIKLAWHQRMSAANNRLNDLQRPHNQPNRR